MVCYNGLMPNQKNLLNSIVLFWAIIFFPSILLANTFNKLVEQKQILENRFGIETLECFPFKKKIGFTEDQIPLVEKCLQGVLKLKEALTHIRQTEYKEVGSSNRFLKTAGFHTILIDWKAPTREIIHFLNQHISLDEQSKFLNKIHILKKEIARKGLVK